MSYIYTMYIIHKGRYRFIF